MGANMMKQALLLKSSEEPYVKTGLERDIGRKQKSPFIINDNLCLGRNLLVGYLPWDFLNYEDGIVISDKLVREDIRVLPVSLREMV